MFDLVFNAHQLLIEVQYMELLLTLLYYIVNKYTYHSDDTVKRCDLLYRN